MRPISHPSNNMNLSEPDGWDEQSTGECIDLPITHTDGVMFSYWMPSLRERLLIALGHPIRLGVFGSRHPPVSIETIS